MNEPQLRAVLEAMDAIERGGPVPVVGGHIGRFLAAYARERREAERLALAQRIRIRPDQGAIEADIGFVRLIPAPASVPLRTVPTSWGDVSLALAFCPELHTLVTVRLWGSAYAAREAIRAFSLNPSGVVDVEGPFRWLPPNVMTAGNARYVGRASRTGESWSALGFLAATADDLYAPPHALEYVVAPIRGKTTIGHVRSFIVRVNPSGEALVPGGAFLNPTDLRYRRREEILPTGLWHVLGYREADTDAWQIWEAAPARADDAISHVVRWNAFRMWLRSEPVDHASLAEHARRALRGVGVSVDPSVVTASQIAEPRTSTERLVRSLLARMRLA